MKRSRMACLMAGRLGCGGGPPILFFPSRGLEAAGLEEGVSDHRVGAVVLGALFVTMLSNSMDLLEVGGYIQQILLGCVIILAIFLDRLRRTRT